jgi:DNA replication protein DnaC
MEARDERRLRALQKHLSMVKLLIVDELGYVPFTAVGSELLFEVFSQRYERGATLVTLYHNYGIVSSINRKLMVDKPTYLPSKNALAARLTEVL